MGTLAIELSGNYSIGIAVWAGIVGAVAMLAVIYGGRFMGMTTMDLLYLLGTMVVPTASRSVAYAAGAAMHLMMGALFGIAHAGVLHGFDPASTGGAAGLGIIIGLIHGGVVVGMMPTMLTMAHPLVRNGAIIRPGTLLTGFGTMTPAGVVAAHGVFGLVAGAVYAGSMG